MGIDVSVLVQTKNEAASIERCVTYCRDFAEVVVLDSMSSDETSAIATASGARVVDFAWNGEYPKKKQWALDNVQFATRWVLFLDADEYPSPHLLKLLRDSPEMLNDPEVAAYDLGLSYSFAGRTLRHGHRVVKRALVDVKRVHFPDVDDLSAPGMGELEGHYQPVADGQVRFIAGAIEHVDLDPVSTWFDRHNRYSDWEAHLEANKPRELIAEFRSAGGRLFHRAPLKPIAFFGWSYFARRGFLDGRAGFDYAIALSMYYWQIGVKTRELRRQRRATD